MQQLRKSDRFFLIIRDPLNSFDLPLSNDCRRFVSFALAFEVFGLCLLATKEYLYGDGFDCIMEGIQNELQTRNETYKEVLRSFCAVYGVPPSHNGFSKNESLDQNTIQKRNQTFINSLDYFIASEREKFKFNLDLFSLVFACSVHLFFILLVNY